MSDSNSDDDSNEVLTFRQKRLRELEQEISRSTKCPYLDTVQRSMLDFDMPKICSVSLSTENIYACLVCGKYFSGRGPSSPAYVHAISTNHHIFLDFESSELYCLPDDHAVVDSSLNDIKLSLNPQFTTESLRTLGEDEVPLKDIYKNNYFPGIIGFNKYSRSDYISVVIQLLAQVKPFFVYFLSPLVPSHTQSPLINSLKVVLKNIWNPYKLKNFYSPIEFVTVVSELSNGAFSPSVSVESSKFLAWFLTTLHAHLLKEGLDFTSSVESKLNSYLPSKLSLLYPSKSPLSIVTVLFQGELEVTLEQSDMLEEKERQAQLQRLQQQDRNRKQQQLQLQLEQEDGHENTITSAPTANVTKEEVLKALRDRGVFAPKKTPFFSLPLDLVETSVFSNKESVSSIAQVDLLSLLEKFTGVTVSSQVGEFREFKKYRVLRLPPFLLMVVGRFKRTLLGVEKDPTVINLPMKDLTLTGLVSATPSLNADDTTNSGDALVPDSFNSNTESDESSLERRKKEEETLRAQLAVQSIAEIKRMIAATAPQLKERSNACVDRAELMDVAVEAFFLSSKSTPSKLSSLSILSYNQNAMSQKLVYDLIGSIKHVVPPEAETSVAADSRQLRQALQYSSLTQTSFVDSKYSNTHTAVSSNGNHKKEDIATSIKISAVSKDPFVSGSFSVQIRQNKTGKWFELQGLDVKEILPHSVPISECYIALYERRT